MREFIPKEREIMQKILSYKKENNIKGLWFYRLLAEIAPGYYIKWNSSSQKCFEKVTLSIKTNDVDFVKLKFQEIVDFILFLDELEEYKLISIRHPNDKISYREVVYDYNTYDIETVDGNVIPEGARVFEKNTKVLVEGNDEFLHHTERLDIVTLIRKYYSSVIYPLPLLDDLVNNGFISIDERRHNQQICRTNISIWVAAAAIIIPICVDKCSDNVVSNDVQVITTAIKEQKSISIDKFPDILPDTLNVKVIDTPEKQPINFNVTVKENQPTKIQ